MAISKYPRRLFVAGLAVLAILPTSLMLFGGRESPAPIPVKRIITTSPHLTELVYYAGAGDLLLAVAPFADFPPEAQSLPRVGGPGGVNIEAILALRPDRVLVWESGTPAWQIERLRSLGINVWVSEIRNLGDIPDWLRHFGQMTGRGQKAEVAARAFQERLQVLEKRVKGRKSQRVFIQVLDHSLYTLSGRHVVSDALRRCGGRNVMGDLPALASRVDIESVLAADPEVIIASGDPRQWPIWQERWRRYPQLGAVRHGRLIFIHPDLLHRPGPRLLDGMERLCAGLGGMKPLQN